MADLTALLGRELYDLTPDNRVTLVEEAIAELEIGIAKGSKTMHYSIADREVTREEANKLLPVLYDRLNELKRSANAAKKKSTTNLYRRVNSRAAVR